MKIIITLFILVVIASCDSDKSEKSASKESSGEKVAIVNQKIKEHVFLDCMYDDHYFPKAQVDKCKGILLDLCHEIEREKPTDLEALYILTNQSTERINALQDEFYENGSEIETGARECLASNFEFISIAYGYDADIEELIADREW